MFQRAFPEGFIANQRHIIDTHIQRYEDMQQGKTDEPPERVSFKRKILPRLYEARQALQDGRYGICQNCGEEIPLPRLTEIPGATRCLECQEKSERVP